MANNNGSSGASDNKNFVWRRKWIGKPRWLDAIALLLLSTMIFWPLESNAMEFEETVFKTGVQGESNGYSVSPDGSRILFITRDPSFNRLRLFDLKSGQVSKIPAEPGHTWEMTSWFRDGKQVVAVSTTIRDGKYQVDEQEVILIDPRDWRHRKLAATPGVNIFPFFSADGKTVYYFKGKKRESGRTPASNYVLYAYDLAENRETRMTRERMYQAGNKGGYDDGDEILLPLYSFSYIEDHEKSNNSGLYALNKATRQLRPLNVIDTSDVAALGKDGGFTWISFDDKDPAGNIYLKVAKTRPGDNHYYWFIYRCDAQGGNCVMMCETTIRSSVRIASDTGEIFINAVEDGALVFRRLIEKPEVQ